jgi:hypothetical protein
MKVSNIKFHENPSSDTRVHTRGQMDGQTDIMKLKGAFFTIYTPLETNILRSMGK